MARDTYEQLVLDLFSAPAVAEDLAADPEGLPVAEDLAADPEGLPVAEDLAADPEGLPVAEDLAADPEGLPVAEDLAADPEGLPVAGSWLPVPVGARPFAPTGVQSAWPWAEEPDPPPACRPRPGECRGAAGSAGAALR